MATFLEAIDSGVRRAFCIAGSTVEGLTGLYEVVIGSGGGGGQSASEAYQRARDFRRLYCNNDEGENPPEGTNIPGQCETTYALSATGETVSSSSGATFPFNDALGASGPILEWVYFLDGNDLKRRLRDANNPNPGSTSVVRSNVASFNITQSYSRVDGLPDDCGSEEPEFPPPNITNVDIDIDYDSDGGPTITLPIGVLFAPVYVSLNGELNVPFTVNVNGEFSLIGELQLTPTFEVNFDFGGKGSGRGQNDENIPLENEEDAGDDPVDNPDSTIIGVVVRSSFGSVARATRIPQNVAPTVLAPRIANVAFAIRVGSLVAWTTDIPVKSVNAYVACPAPQGAQDVRVTWEPDAQGQYTPIRGKPLQPFEP